MALDIGPIVRVGEREVEVPNWQDEPVAKPEPQRTPEREKELESQP